jgi:hypothetical protein
MPTWGLYRGLVLSHPVKCGLESNPEIHLKELQGILVTWNHGCMASLPQEVKYLAKRLKGKPAKIWFLATTAPGDRLKVSVSVLVG